MVEDLTTMNELLMKISRKYQFWPKALRGRGKRGCSNYKVGVGRRKSNGRFCKKGRSGCSTDGALAHAIRVGRSHLAKSKGGCSR